MGEGELNDSNYTGSYVTGNSYIRGELDRLAMQSNLCYNLIKDAKTVAKKTYYVKKLIKYQERILKLSK